MNAADDDLTQVRAEGFLIFMYAERRRHEADVSMCSDVIKQTIIKYNIDSDKQFELIDLSQKYVEF